VILNGIEAGNLISCVRVLEQLSFLQANFLGSKAGGGHYLQNVS